MGPQTTFRFGDPDDRNPKKRWKTRPGYFDKGAARRADPPSSKNAAESIDANSLEMAFLNCLRINGPCTTEEAANLMEMSIVTISPRPAPLVRKNLIEPSGEKRKGKSGRDQIVWRLKGS